ncbi:hypothetical protein PG996_004477 [Apiospora saccharicola]|uniref:Uncharacterized protein n=1 Tax=Apiospora saccharicola TaxID=335842 RepID=A0ABR1W5G1_9PEZI
MYFFGWGIIHDEPKFANDGGGGLYGVIRNRHKRGCSAVVFGGGSDLEEFARHELARRWVNRHAFYTNLYGIGWVNISMECAHFIELAFMKPPAAHAAEDPAWPDNHVAAAAQWIDYSGPALSRELKSPSGAKTNPPRQGRRAPKGESVERTMVYHVFLDAAEQIPYDHMCQMKLARLVFALRGPPRTGTVEKLVRDRRQSKGLVAYPLKHPYEEVNLEEPASRERAQRWIKVNAFYANISVWSWDKTSSYMRRVMALAFDNGFDDLHGLKPYARWTRDEKYWRDPHVSAAAQWIIYSGQYIFRGLMNPSETLEIEHESPFRLPRVEPLSDWRRWKQGFRDVSNDPERQDEARALAKRAANLMEALEENMMPRWGEIQVAEGQNTKDSLAGSSASLNKQPDSSQ